jgi:aminopeptidase-like protein
MRKSLEFFFDRLWPINRSLTGKGNRETLTILSEMVDLKITEVPSGTRCFDWEIPPEWNVRRAYIKNSSGDTIVDFEKNNLHLLGYSTPFKGTLTLSELNKHLYSLPDQPNDIPYLTSYYEKRWGFCLSQNQRNQLIEDNYEIHIDSDHDPNGSMSIGEAVLEGDDRKEILLSTYICHPSMANNELSGILTTSFLYNELKKIKNRRYTYRFLFLPETIGSIYYLSVNQKSVKDKVVAGFVVTCIGDRAPFTYKKSRNGNTLSDKAAILSLSEGEESFLVKDFFPSGSDERQYCSPGFNLPVGSLFRSQYGLYKEYHTSSDNKAFISFLSLEKSVRQYLDIFTKIENNFYYQNLKPFCEPQLGRKNIFSTLGALKDRSDLQTAIKWVLNYSDGENDLIDITNKSKIKFDTISQAAEILEKHQLLKKLSSYDAV